MNSVAFRLLIEQGDAAGVARALQAEPGLANGTIHWYLNQHNESDPLHYVSDCVAHGWLTNGSEGEITQLLLDAGAVLEGNAGRESPLLASVSLGAPAVTSVLLQAGADPEATALYAARPLHWAAWMGCSATVELLLARGATVDPRCAEFGATPLFWAVHGYSPQGPRPTQDQVGAARLLIQAGAEVVTQNKQGLSALDLARTCQNQDMYELLVQSL